MNRWDQSRPPMIKRVGPVGNPFPLSIWPFRRREEPLTVAGDLTSKAEAASRIALLRSAEDDPEYG